MSNGVEHKISIGDRFGSLIAKSKDRYICADGKRRWKWTAVCDCGNEIVVVPAHLVRTIRSCKPCGYVRRGENTRIPGISNPRANVYRNYISTAKRRGIEFGLSREQFNEIVCRPCAYCNATETSYFNAQQPWEKDFRYTGIDRVDSSQGYSPDNIVPCCKVCNRAKSDLSGNEFRLWVITVYNQLTTGGK